MAWHRAIGLAACWFLLAFASASAADETYDEQIRPLLERYCSHCHDAESKQGGLVLEHRELSDDAALNRIQWWKVLKNLRAGVMPPAGEPRPTPAEFDVISNWIKFQVFEIDAQQIDPGPLPVRRLNRREYDNTIDDLLGIKFDASILFPPDDSGHGFDNVGDALSFPPLLLEKYLRAAQSAVDAAVPKVTWIIPYQEIAGRDFRSDDGKTRGDRLSSRTPVSVQQVVPITEDGQFDVRLFVKLHGSFDFDPSRYTIVFRIDDDEQLRQEYGWDENKPYRFVYQKNFTAGEHRLSFELIPVAASGDGDKFTSIEAGNTFASFEVVSVKIEGPAGTPRRVHPRGYERIFTRDEPPVESDERVRYAADILRRFAVRAYRGPVDEETITRLVQLARSVYEQPAQTFETGVSHALVAVLASPRFLFRLESIDPETTDDLFPAVDDYSLAARLSYLFWSTTPDEELLRLAEQHELRNQLAAQVQRMLKDERSGEFIRNFVGQWLRTRDVTQVSIDPIVVLGYQDEFERLREQFRNRRRQSVSRELSPEDEQLRKRFGELRAIADRFNDDMRRAMRRETEMCVESLVKDDGSLLDLLDADYTFVNEKLAELYGIPGVRGGEMRRVKLPEGSPRGGVLTHASMLLVTSNPTRTSPVKRGLFVLENLLGTPSPPAPPGIPDLEESAQRFAGREPALRELLAAHRESALCSSCHSRMDPLGIALENFNALGMWRESERELPIDASGTLVTGESFHDVRDLKKILRERHASDFYRCVTEKMLTYALGRGLEYSDEHSVDLIVQRLTESGGRFSSLMQGVIDSAPFQRQRRRTEQVSSQQSETSSREKEIP